MTAANASAQPSSLENERRAHEPSMEEILASIRKIIADDDALPLSRPTSDGRTAFQTPRPFESNVTRFEPPPLPPIESAPEPEQEAPASTAEAAPQPAEIEAQVEEVVASAVVEALVPPMVQAASHPAAETGQPADLDDSELASFAEIAKELSIERPLRAEPPKLEAPAEQVPPPPAPPPAVELEAEPDVMLSPQADASVASAFRALSASVQLTNSEMIERHVRDLLRPMLKQWLDDNLPVMVERLVRAEIERVARGGR
jgi:uncharacterized protein